MNEKKSIGISERDLPAINAAIRRGYDVLIKNGGESCKIYTQTLQRLKPCGEDETK